MSPVDTVLLALAALIILFVVYRVISARQAARYLEAASGEGARLARSAGKRSPAQLDEDMVNLPVKNGMLTPRAKVHIRNQLWPDLGKRVSSQAMKQWRKTSSGTRNKAFAVHAYLDDFALSEVIADANAYPKLPQDLEVWMDELTPTSHLKTDIRATFAEYIDQAGAACAIQRVGKVDRPVEADIYAVKSGRSLADSTPSSPPADNASVTQQWSSYRQWLEHHAPDNVASLNPGATREQFDLVEQVTGTSLTEEFKEFYGLHDGQPWDSTWVFPEGQWMPLEQVIEAWQQARDVLGSTWQSGWIPMVSDGGAGYTVSDQSRAGALMTVWFEEESPEDLAVGIGTWLASLNSQIERGRMRYDPQAQQPVVDE